MPAPEARIADISTGLAALGLTPELKARRDQTTVEARVPESFPAESWPAVLALLETADAFGLNDSAARGRSLWAVIRRSAPSAGEAAEGPPVQP